MIDPDVRVKIRHYFFAEHWKIGTIAAELQVHPDTVRRAIEVEQFPNAPPLRASLLDPYLPFLRETLEAHPRLRVTRLHRMLRRSRLYEEASSQLRRVRGAFTAAPARGLSAPQVFAGEEAQVDWAHFWRRDSGPRATHAELLRDDLVMVAGAVPGVLLRPDDGELSARPCTCLRVVPGFGEGPAYTTI